MLTLEALILRAVQELDELRTCLRRRLRARRARRDRADRLKRAGHPGTHGEWY